MIFKKYLINWFKVFGIMIAVMVGFGLAKQIASYLPAEVITWTYGIFLIALISAIAYVWD